MFNEKFMTTWTGRTIAQKTYAQARAYFKANVKAITDFRAVGGQVNTYATASAATELKEAVASALAEFAESNKENAMAVGEVKDVRE